MSEARLKGLCMALKPLLEHELSSGNYVVAVESGWSKVKLAVRLAVPLDMAYISQAAALNSDLEVWRSRDIKNPQEAGVLCRSAAQTLAGPLENKQDSLTKRTS
jgi:hypothetical protein